MPAFAGAFTAQAPPEDAFVIADSAAGGDHFDDFQDLKKSAPGFLAVGVILKGDQMLSHALVSHSGIYDKLSEGDSRHVRTGAGKHYT
jgi:hypothetical protein